MVLEAGVDEAGKGPVLGPMVMAGVLIDDADIPKLKKLGVKDSKLLTPAQREKLYPEIIKIVKDYKILIIPPAEIDEAVQSETLNLNRLEAIKSAMICNSLNPERIILDCPSTNIKSYVEYFKYYLKRKSVEIIAEHKADVNYPSVSAASILAKVTRDAEIEKIKKEIGYECGSGYPSDPTTIEFLKKYHKRYEHIFRKSWATYQNVVKNKPQKSLSEY
ncbi:MAG TPA: ribonuclease HII [Candidatus Nanoarchaeia archaeon]|nr:ribonuclease HII [Candidatus Nanoarchaeia archaeon]